MITGKYITAVATIITIIPLGIFSMRGTMNIVKVTPQNSDSTLVDSDGNVYTTKVMMDGKRWLAQNLSIKIEGSYCYNDSESNCQRYGRLYTWEAVGKACKIIGDGWRLPTYDEWSEMINYYGGIHKDSGSDGKEAYKALIAGGFSEFNVIFGGNRNVDGTYGRLEAHGFYWTSTEDKEGLMYINFGKGASAVYCQNGGEKLRAFSIRLIRD